MNKTILNISIFISFNLLLNFITFTQTRIKDVEISQDSIKTHLQFLAGDSLKGRAAGTEGAEKAAKYIALNLKKLGLKPASENSSYFQNVPMHGSSICKSSELKLYTNSREIQLKTGKDYLLYKNGAQTFIPNPVQLVFVGYGITAPEYGYDSYKKVNVEGKVVVFISGEPENFGNYQNNGHTPTIHSSIETKQRVAFSRGARGSIFISGFGTDDENIWQEKIKKFSFEDISLSYSNGSNLNLLVNYKTAEQLFSGSGYTLSQIFEMTINNNLESLPLPVLLSFKGNFKERDFISCNVIGLLEGNDPFLKNEYLIISAHYDHLGTGMAINGDSIYNGAIDNASGVASALEIARYLSKIKDLKRSVIFIFTTGEENGLLGSEYYTTHPIFPLYKTFACINVDGIAFLDNFKSIIGIGSNYSSFNTILAGFCKDNKLNIENIPDEFLANESFYQSDQFAFAKAGIPSILISEGFDYVNLSYNSAIVKMINWFKTVYHSPSDDLKQELNYNAMLQHTLIIAEFCRFLLDNSSVPEWNSDSPFLNARLQTIYEKR